MNFIKHKASKQEEKTELEIYSYKPDKWRYKN